MRRIIMVTGVALLSFVAGAAVAGRPEKVSHDLPAEEIPDTPPSSVTPGPDDEEQLDP